jgi:hypothetical protein
MPGTERAKRTCSRRLDKVPAAGIARSLSLSEAAAHFGHRGIALPPLPPPNLRMIDRHAELRDKVLAQVLQGPGESAPALREAAAGNAGLPEELRQLIAKVHAHAYKVTDADIARLQSSYGDDKLFEIIVSAALGASRKRLMAGLDALAQA